MGAVLCDADDDWSNRSHIVPASIAELWEPSLDPADEDIEGQRRRLIVIAGLDAAGRAA